MNDLYIHQLETENKQIREQLQLCRNAINEIKEELNKTIDAKDKIINEQALEIARLKEQLENDIDKYEDTISYQLGFDKGKEYLQQKIEKAIEYIKENACYGIQEKCCLDDLNYNNCDELLEILGDKENE